jgi:hypothetical protein
LVAVAALLDPARAEDPPTVEVSGGGEIGAHTWSVHTSTTMALAGWLSGVPKSIREDGWRLKVGAGYWEFARKDRHGFPATTDPRRTVRMSGSFADVLLGYHKGLGALTVKAYAGVDYATSSGDYDGFAWQSDFDELGAKILFESWYNLTPDAFFQLDVSWSSRRDEFAGRARLGYRIMPGLAVGPEFAYWSARSDPIYPEWYGSRDDLTRAGAFIRYEWPSGEVSLSGGLADDGRDDAFYATLNALLRF